MRTGSQESKVKCREESERLAMEKGDSGVEELRAEKLKVAESSVEKLRAEKESRMKAETEGRREKERIAEARIDGQKLENSLI